MKIMVLNFSGNVGKTTVAVHLLKSRMPDATFFSIESINAGAVSDGLKDIEVMRGKNFGTLIDEIMMLDSAIIDVGASNVETLLLMMQQYVGSHEEIDLFIIPVVSQRKVMSDTINTIKALSLLGVGRERIKVVFNRVDFDDDLQSEFSPIFGFELAENSFITDEHTIVYNNEIFERLKYFGKSLGDVSEDNTDYRALLRQAETEEEKHRCITMIALKRLSITANKNLDAVFNSLMGR